MARKRDFLLRSIKASHEPRDWAAPYRFTTNQPNRRDSHCLYGIWRQTFLVIDQVLLRLYTHLPRSRDSHRNLKRTSSV